MRPTSRVLIVDDDAGVRRMLARSLEAEGYAVALASDGGGALVEIERSPPDVILLDVSMPGLDGLGVARRLRGKGDAVPILLLTARDAVADRVAGLDAGADDYLVKPFATDELLARVRALLRRGQTAGDLLSVGDVTLDLRMRSASRAGRDLALTPRECDLLELLLRNARSRRVARSGAGPCLGRRRSDGQCRRSLRGLPAPEARRSSAHPDGARGGVRARAMRKPASLRVRVALAAGAAIALATVLLGITAVALSEREQASSRDAALRAGATQVAQLSASAPALLTAPGALEGRVGGRRLLVEVVDRRGRIVARSASLGGGVLGTRAEIAGVIASGRAHYSDARLGTAPVRLYRAPLASVGTGPAAGGAVLVATGTEEDEHAAHRLRALVLLAAIAAAVLAVGIALLLTRRALRPLTDLSAAAGAIAETGDATRRLPRPTRVTRSARCRRRSMRCSPRSSRRASPSAASSPMPRTSCGPRSPRCGAMPRTSPSTAPTPTCWPTSRATPRASRACSTSCSHSPARTPRAPAVQSRCGWINSRSTAPADR